MALRLFSLSVVFAPSSVNQSCWNFWWYCHRLPVRFCHNSFSMFLIIYYLKWEKKNLMLCWLEWLCRYAECTSAAIQALTLFKKLYPGHRREEIENCIAKAARFIEKIQAPDGSWFASTLFLYLHLGFCFNEFFPLIYHSLLLLICIYLSKRKLYLCIQLILFLIYLGIVLGSHYKITCS